jgi:tRNA(Ile)-lysidine synthase
VQRFNDDPWEATLDADRLSFPLVLRAVREGDRFRPLGMEGSQKVQDFMVNAKVSREERRRVAVLESAGRIVWLVGWRIDDRYKVTPETRRVVSIQATLLARNT